MSEFKKIQSQTPLDIITAAAKIIKNDITVMPCDKKEYPDISRMQDIEYAMTWIPESLTTFLSHLVSSSLKQASIGQVITQNSRPPSMIAFIPFSIGVDINNSFTSKWLVDHLSQFGFSVSSDEAKLFKQSAITSSRETQAEECQNNFTQWIADNVDHNSCKLTGKDKFHGTGIISASLKPTRSTSVIRRLKHKEFSEFTESNVPIILYHGSSVVGLFKFKLKAIRKLSSPKVPTPEMNLDLLWQTSWFFKKSSSNPNCSGFMQAATKPTDERFKKESIDFLPIIGLDPNDETSIYSTLQFVIREAARLGIPTPCITFDQPLWQKATGIIKIENLNVVCRLGGFYTLMSFMGSIGNMMAGSGLKELLEEVYAENTVPHLLSGKAYAKALRAHLLVLVSHIIQFVVEEKSIDLSALEIIYNKAINDGITDEDLIQLQSRDAFKQIRDGIDSY